MTTTFAFLLVFFAFPILLLIWATESRSQRAKRLRSYGWSQQKIAYHLRVSRSTVQRILATA